MNYRIFKFLLEYFFDCFYSNVFFIQGPCSDALGLETGAIGDDQITASSFKTGSEPRFARIRSKDSETSSWSPTDDDETKYLEVNFNYPVEVSGISTQGGNGNGQYVSKYYVMYSNGDGWQTLKYSVNGEPDETYVFMGKTICVICDHQQISLPK